MEPEGSLPHSQVPATCPYPEPAPTSHFLKMHLNTSIIIHACVFPVVSFPHVSPPKPCTLPSPTRATCPAHLTLTHALTRTQIKNFKFWSKAPKNVPLYCIKSALNTLQLAFTAQGGLVYLILFRGCRNNAVRRGYVMLLQVQYKSGNKFLPTCLKKSTSRPFFFLYYYFLVNFFHVVSWR